MQDNTLTIAARIVNDAQLIAKSTLEEGRIKANEIISRAQMDADIYITTAEAEIERLTTEVIRQKRSATLSDVRKLILKAKKEAIDKAFIKAQEILMQLPNQKYLELIKGMLNYAENNDTVLIYKNEKRLITKKFIDAVALIRGIKLNVDFMENNDLERGIKLVSDNVEKDCTISTELSALRADLELDLLDVLFKPNE
ncbi:MAG: hypothetical protein LBF68_00595 [Christensenellaceae bacterium]|jgi:vacuolar-type H+-ATPase subunit E/Vma4|nr:hypothetical protein [Christensenellaceae bacterium]